MKLKYLAILLVLLIGTLLGIVYYYGLDPSLLTKLSFYENLANPSVRIVRVQEGLRKEEIAEVMFNKLDWGGAQKNEFINAHLALNVKNLEGHYFPKTYLIDKDETPSAVSTTMFDEFSKQTEKIKKPTSKDIIPEGISSRLAAMSL